MALGLFFLFLKIADSSVPICDIDLGVTFFIKMCLLFFASSGREIQELENALQELRNAVDIEAYLQEELDEPPSDESSSYRSSSSLPADVISQIDESDLSSVVLCPCY